MLIPPEDLFNVAASAINGKFPDGRGQSIRNSVLVMMDQDPMMDAETIHSEFMEYFWDKRLQTKYKGDSKPAAYIVGCLYYFMLNKKRQKPEPPKCQVPEWKLIDEDAPMERIDGVWKQAEVMSEFNTTTSGGVEKQYLHEEMLEVIGDFTLENYGEVVLAVFHGQLTHAQAADRMGCSERWFRDVWSRYKKDLTDYLVSMDYSIADL